MKLCKDCEYLYLDSYCHAPQNGISPVDGRPKPTFAIVSRQPKSAPLSTATLEDFGCGPAATFFKQKVEPKQRPWYKFWR